MYANIDINLSVVFLVRANEILGYWRMPVITLLGNDCHNCTSGSYMYPGRYGGWAIMVPVLVKSDVVKLLLLAVFFHVTAAQGT